MATYCSKFYTELDTSEYYETTTNSLLDSISQNNILRYVLKTIKVLKHNKCLGCDGLIFK